MAQTPVQARGMRELVALIGWTALPAAVGGLAAAQVFTCAAAESCPAALTAYTVSILHLSALGLFLHRSPLPTRLAPLALVAIAWWIPAAIPPLTGLLDPSPRLAGTDGGPETWGAMAPVGTLLLAALLLPRPRGPKR